MGTVGQTLTYTKIVENAFLLGYFLCLFMRLVESVGMGWDGDSEGGGEGGGGGGGPRKREAAGRQT